MIRPDSGVSSHAGKPLLDFGLLLPPREAPPGPPGPPAPPAQPRGLGAGEGVAALRP